MELLSREKFYLNRKRQGRTRSETAILYNVDENAITAWEKGYNEDVPSIILEFGPTAAERCRILRRRKGWSMKLMGKKMKMSLAVIYLIENGQHSPKKMIEFFKKDKNADHSANVR